MSDATASEIRPTPRWSGDRPSVEADLDPLPIAHVPRGLRGVAWPTQALHIVVRVCPAVLQGGDVVDLCGGRHDASREALGAEWMQ